MIVKCNRHFGSIGDYQTHKDAYEAARNLYGEASRTVKCLEILNENGIAIPQVAVNVFIVQEKPYEEEAA